MNVLSQKELLIEAGDSGSPVNNHPSMKMALRSMTSRGRLAKSSPKSPLMRMAEMRMGGLRGRALRQSGIMVLEVSGVKSVKGRKGKRGRKPRILASIPEGNDSNGALVVYMEGKDGAEAVGVSLELKGSSMEGGSTHSVQIPAGDVSDLALDLISSQPLQDMEFIGEQVLPASVIEVSTASGKDSLMEEVSLHAGIMENVPQRVLPSIIGEDFPPLSKEELRMAREKDRNRGVGGNAAESGLEQQPKGNQGRNKEDPVGSLNFKGESSKGAGGKNFKDLLAWG